MDPNNNNNNNRNHSKNNRTNYSYEQDDNDNDDAAKTKGRSSPPSRPASAAASLARLDQRLAEKLAKEQRPSQQPQPQPQRTNQESTNRRAAQALAALEQDVHSKVAASASYSKASRPGVESISGESADPVAAKVRRDHRALPGKLQSLEDAVHAKVRGDATGHSDRPPQSVLARPNELYALEDQVQAKIRRDGGPTVMGAVPAASSSRSPSGANWEQRIATKIQANPSMLHREAHDPEDEEDGKRPAAVVASSHENGLHRDKLATYTQNIDNSGSNNNQPSWKAPEQAKEPSERLSQRRHDGALGRPEQTQPDVEFGVVSTGLGAAGLAVAVAVEDDDDDMFIPSAVEYDPDAKPPMYRHRRFRLYALLAFFVVIVVAIGAAVGATIGKQSLAVTDAPTMAPTSTRESFGIRAQVERLVGLEVLEDEESPYSKALEWITFDDPMQLTPDADNFVQRYIAAYLYHATTEDGPWLSCTPPENAWTDPTDCQFKQLAAIFPLNYIEVPWNRWLSNISECQWAGVVCDEEGQFRSMDLSGNELSGSFPEGIRHLPYLQSLTLSWCSLRGTLPSELAQMKHLNAIELHYNQFTGTVPTEWFKIRGLQRLNVGDNMLSGSIPTEIGNLLDAKGIFYFTNMITGSIPTEVGNLNSLAYFRLSRNALTGTFPSTAFQWRGIEEIWLHRNQLTGTISSEFGRLTTLNDMRLHANPLTGTIPTEIYSMPSLERLDLWDCQLSGTIASEIGLLVDHFYTLRISGNKFRGTLPVTMANLTEISEIWINGNDFTGTVPEELCALENKIDYTLESFSADCLPDDNGVAEITCPVGCCTICCRADGTGCMETGSV